jgi:cold shock CspA family protein
MSMADTATNQYVGKVKWFNNKSGYGFITFINSSDFKGKDIFAHHSSLNVKDEIYKYLVQGEYIEFNIQKMDSGNHEYQATNIKGILQNDLMCETRHKNRDLSKNSDSLVIKSHSVSGNVRPSHKHAKS